MAILQYDVKQNPLHEISLTSVALGSLIGTFLTLIIILSSRYRFIFAYVIIQSFYYFNEFDTTARYQARIVKAKLFLIWGNNGNKEFLMMCLFTIWEFLFTNSLVCTKLLHYLFGIDYVKENGTTFIGVGLSMVSIGLYIRRLAMKTCGDSFSHYIEISNRDQKIITTGIYGWFRHPSYFGFWLFAVGCQVFLGNWAGLVINIVVLGWFFKKRIEFEEWFLINRIFGDQYRNYKTKVGLWIPFVVLKKDL